MDIAARVISVVGRTSTSDPSTASSSNPPKVGRVMDVSDGVFIGGFIPSLIEKQRYPYSRPEFLYFSEEEIALSSDHSVRPVLCPRFPHRMPLYVGYAEAINAGKTVQNEDQASAKMLVLTQHQGNEMNGFSSDEKKSETRKRNSNENDDDPMLTPGGDDTEKSSMFAPRADGALFSLFDGHAGSAVAVVASKCLHEHVKSRLCEVLDTILHMDRHENLNFGKHRSESSYSMSEMSREDENRIRSEHLVKGALETAFLDMDEQIAQDKQVWRLPGGCAVISVLVFLGKLYIANAGDCRAILVTSDGSRALSKDLTPASERKRLQELAYRNPELIGNSFSRLEYSKRLTIHDLKSRVLYRDWFMDGWAVKTVKECDLRPSLISETSRKKRLLNTIGVSRGFGDHHLLTVDERLSIKPFLSAVPEISVTNLRDMNTLTDKDVVIVASDGLWDVLSNEDAGLIVRSTLGSTDSADPSRYTQAAQDLVAAARGQQASGNLKRWVMNTGGHASYDDITVFVIPLKYCAAPPTNMEDEEDDEMLSLE
ncbi:PPM-type phosphatase domain-containing protein [Caenorhabditis elegans]|uniref:PPM-type phosphatase domain-containing protein n=1 Tax=Caenorhabditis elegans TaxID=6239 RepID=A3QMB1_CAEEL|nr:PPM-type phosphatase domain-containing protein [Caenorhabditis elegans]CAM36343.2 PPM-type phosphatase domain-containing protein [Caenorhabditis elegans]|eukprot:NP_502329.3 Protein Phosphatase, Mg2+/Mn2+ dependent [Caenorhabditis elegans]